MAGVLKFFRQSNPLFFNYLIKNSSFNGTIRSSINRFIFTEGSLGLSGYNNSRSQIKYQFANVETSFREKMKEIIENENSVIFTEDLKVMLHLVEKNPDDIDLILKMMHRFNNQNRELRFGSYVFGPVAMRAFYYLDEPDIAIETFFNPQLVTFFDQMVSYTVFLSLLYKHKMYSKMREAFDIIKTRHFDIRRFPSNALIITVAACHAENTPESFQYALQNWSELHQKGIRPIRRVVTFIADLALKQNSPEVALEVLTVLTQSQYIDVRCLKILAFCHLNRLVDVIPFFRRAIENKHRRENFFLDVIEAVQEKLENEDEHIKKEITHLLSILNEHGHIENMTLESHITTPIHITYNKNKTNDSLSSFPRKNISEPNKKRLGLNDFL